MSAATAWAYVMALVTGALALWGVLCLLGSAGRRLAPGRGASPALPPPHPSSRPLHGGITLHVLPCGCIYYYQRIDRDPCGPHAQLVADRDEINRLDQQIRNMP